VISVHLIVNLKRYDNYTIDNQMLSVTGVGNL